MKELKFVKGQPQPVKGTLRIIGKLLFYKYNDTQQSKSVINEFRKKGIEIEEGNGWIKVNLLGTNEVIKLRDIEIDINEDSDQEIEDKFYKFYNNEFKRLGFYVT